MKRKGLFISIAILVILSGFCVSCGKTGADTPDMDAIEALIESGDYEAAQSQLEILLEKDASNAEAHFQYGLVLFNQDQFALAKEQFLKALELDASRAPSVHHNLGVLAFRIGDLTTAQQEFQAALDLDPNDPDSHYQLGATYLVLAFPAGSMEPDMEQIDNAMAEFNTALELQPGKPEPLVGIANIYLLQNEYDAAIGVLQQALEQKPEMREALFALGKAYMMAGEFDLAKSTLEKFVQTDPPQQWVDQANEMLTQLGD